MRVMISVNGLGTWIRAQHRLTDRLPASAGIGLGLLGGVTAAWVALDRGTAAVGVLVVGFAWLIWGVGRRMRLVAAGYPPEVAVEPTPPGPRLGGGSVSVVLSLDAGPQYDRGRRAGVL